MRIIPSFENIFGIQKIPVTRSQPSKEGLSSYYVEGFSAMKTMYKPIPLHYTIFSFRSRKISLLSYYLFTKGNVFVDKRYIENKMYRRFVK